MNMHAVHVLLLRFLPQLVLETDTVQPTVISEGRKMGLLAETNAGGSHGLFFPS